MTLPRRQEFISTRPLVDKLGVKPGARVAIVDVTDAALPKLLAERTEDVVFGQPLPGTDLVFLAADSIDELGQLGALRGRLRPDGAIWVVSRKGRARTIRDVEIIAAAVANGLVDNKVVSFSPTHSALRVVIPRALRGADRTTRAIGTADQESAGPAAKSP